MWIFYALLAGICLSASFEATSALRKRHHYTKFMMASGIVSLVSVPFVPFIHAEPLPAIVLIASGLLMGFANVAYFKSFTHLNALTMSVCGQLMPVLVLVSSWVVLGKEMSFTHMTAFLVIMSGSFIAAVQKGDSRKESLMGFSLFLTALAFGSFFHVANSYAANDNGMSGLHAAILSRFGMALSSFALLAGPMRRRMLELFREREQLKFYRNEMFSASFLVLATLSVAAKPKMLNPSLVNVTYYGACQIMLFMYFAFVKKKDVKQSAVGAMIAFIGLVYLATR